MEKNTKYKSTSLLNVSDVAADLKALIILFLLNKLK